MTIIAAASIDGEAWIGSDSQGTDGWGMTCDSQKLFKAPFGYWGVTGSYSQIPHLKKAFGSIERIKTSAEQAAASVAVRGTLKEAGWKGELEGGLPANKQVGALLVTNEGAIFELWEDLHLFSHGENAAIGSGYGVALGAMHAWGGYSAKEMVRAGVSAACDIVSTCGGRKRHIKVTP